MVTPSLSALTLCCLSFQDPVAQLPTDMVGRAFSVFFIILKYAVDLLTWEHEDLLPAGLQPP